MPDAQPQNSAAVHMEELRPLHNNSVLVLDSGRDDGVTEACCMELVRLGAQIALAYVVDDHGFEAACRLVRNVKAAGGRIVAVEGIPYRHETYSNVTADGVGYIGHLVQRALAMLDIEAFEVIGKCTVSGLRRGLVNTPHLV